MKTKINILTVFLSALIFQFLNSPNAIAQPKYIMEVTRGGYVDEPPAAPYNLTDTVTLLESEDGSLFHNIAIEGMGLAGNTHKKNLTDYLAVYVRGNPNGNIPWRLTKTYNGSLGSYPSNYCHVGGASFPGINHSWQTAGHDTSDQSTPAWIYQTPKTSLNSKTMPISYSQYTTGTTSGVARVFSLYPGTNYYRVGYYTIGAEERRRYWSCGGTTFTASGSDPYSFVDVNYGFRVSTDTVNPRKRLPGNTPGPTQQFSCGGGGNGESGSPAPGAMSAGPAPDEGLMSLSQNIATGNVLFTLNDPVKTRGYPLRNRIHISTQTVEYSRPMGNGTFTYDIHVTTQSLVPSGGGSPANHWILADGDGQRLNFGLASGAPDAEPGVYSTLTQTGSGFELTNAGPPEQIRKAGNFSYEFDSNGNLLTVTDPAGNQQVLTYSSGQLQSVLDVNSNKSLTYTFTGSRVTKITENGGNTETHITYTSDKITKIELKESSTVIAKVEFTLDAYGRPATMTRDGLASSVYNFSYVNQTSSEPTGSVNLTSVSWKDGSANTAYNLDPQTHASRTEVIDSSGKSYSYEFDSNWNLKSMTLPELNGGTSDVTYTYTYDSDNNMLTKSDGTVTTTYEYTANGILDKIIEPGGYYKQFNYSGANLTSIEDSLGTIVTLTYGNGSLPNLPTEIEDALGNTWTYTYNAYGQITQIDPPTGSPSGSTAYTYDESSSSSPTYGWLTQVTDGEGSKVTFDTYNDLGDVTSISTYTDPANSATQTTTTYSYDAAHRVKVVTHPDSKTITNSYNGFFLSYTDDEASKRTNYTWCADCGAPSSVSKPLSWSVSWERNYDKQVKNFIDSRGYKTAYSYGEAKELVGITYPDSTTEEFEYNNYGKLDKIINGRLEDSEIDYDTVGRISEISFPTTSDPSIDYTYRSDSLVDEVTDAVGTTSYEYTDTRLIEAINYDYTASGLTNVQRIEYTYNEDYSIASVTWKDGTNTVATWTYGYDLAGRLETVTSFGETTTYTYDGQDKILTQANHNGTETLFTYNDDRGWPTNITHEESSTPFAEYELTYDAGVNSVGNLTRVDESGSDYIVYAYNDLHRLTSETRTGTGSYANTFVYDLAGNLTTLNSNSFSTYDNANKIATIPSGSITHDNDGDITAVTGAGLSATTFTWDTRSKLVSQNNSSVTIDYGYDASGRRIWSKAGSDPEIYYIYSGDKLIGEISGSGELPTAAYTWGADGLISERRVQDTETYWYHFGPQGETRQLTDDTGSIVNTYAYDAYGKTLSSSGSIVNPYRYGGKYGYYSHGSAGMMLAGARWYSPDLKRWVSRDPINYEGGYNLYGYVEQNPVGFVDPDGKNSEAVRGVGAIGSAIGGIGSRIGSAFAGAGTGIVVGGGVAAGLLIGECLFEGADGCRATLQGMCASNARPTLEEQADDLKKICGKDYYTQTRECNIQPDKYKCLENARKKFLRCQKQADGLKPAEVK